MTPGEGTRNFYRQQGYLQAVTATTSLIESRQCFDFKTKGNCDHGGCWALYELAKTLVKGTN